MLAARCITVVALGLAGSAMLGGCATTTDGGAVGAERKQLLLVSSQELDQMAAQSYAKLKADAAAPVRSIRIELLQRVSAIAADSRGPDRPSRRAIGSGKSTSSAATSSTRSACPAARSWCTPGSPSSSG
jgi:hypothetical protein